MWKNYGTVDGTFYGLYFKAAHKSTVWYSPSAFDQAGVERAQELRRTCSRPADTLADSGSPAFSVAGEDGWTLTDWFENIYLSQAGPENYDKLASPQAPVDRRQRGQGAHHPRRAVQGQAARRRRRAAARCAPTSPSSVEQVFGPKPKAGMVYEGDFVGGMAKDEFGKKLGEDAKFFPFPAVDGGKAPVVSGGDAAVVLKDGKNQKAAHALLEFLATPEAAEVWAERGRLPLPEQATSTSPRTRDDTTRAHGQVPGRRG